MRHPSRHALLAAKCSASSGTFTHMAWERAKKRGERGKKREGQLIKQKENHSYLCTLLNLLSETEEAWQTLN